MHFFNAIKEKVTKAADGYQNPSIPQKSSSTDSNTTSHNYFEKKGEINEIKK